MSQASSSPSEPLTGLTEGMAVVVGGDRVVRVPTELAEEFAEGDRLLTVPSTGALLHVPAAVGRLTEAAVDRAAGAFTRMGAVSDEAVTAFFERFADRLADDATFAPIAEANAADVAAAQAKGRSTTRLVLSDTMRADMIDGLRTWGRAASGRDEVVDRVDHDGWSVELRRAGLGVVGFVFEGRPNVFADACGVIRSGNTVVFRIGSDALGTARAIVAHALDPAIELAGLPPGAATLVGAAERSAGSALFSDRRLALAVARGSGAAVAQLGAVAQAAGVPVSLHGTGGAWIIAGDSADAGRLESAVTASLDRKVCNTLNTAVVLRSRAAELVPIVLAGLRAAADARGTNPKLWVHQSAAELVPEGWRAEITVARAQGDVAEPGAEALPTSDLGREWEWEASPEISLAVADDLAQAIGWFNTHSPHFVASIISEDAAEAEAAYQGLDAPFVGNGFTRWVDGQYAFDRPELGLSNWEQGRLFGRGGVLSGDSVFTLRARVTQRDPNVAR
ncbi:MAG: aldehyde dehydrogenase family protein [Microthrixaceae bacterium]